MLKSQFFIAAALIAGVAIGYFVRPSENAAAPDNKGYVAKGKIADTGDAASMKALRRRIAELEKMLAEKGEKSEVAISNAVAEAVKDAPRRPFGNPREWMENLKKTDPERFTQMTNRFAQWRRRRADQARSRMDFLASVDTSHMSASAKKTHGELQELIARREELEEQMHQENLTDDQRRELFEQMRETDQAMRRLNQQERANLLEETAKGLGFEGQDVKDISTTIQEVIEATGGNGRGGFGPPPGGPGGPGGGPGGAPGGPGGR